MRLGLAAVNAKQFHYLTVSVKVVVLVTLPPVPVIVIVEVPALAAGATLIDMAEVPEPPAMEVGLKVTRTPFGTPEAVKLIAVLKPPEGVAVILAVAWPPGAMLPFVGVEVSVKLPVGAGARALIRLAPFGLPKPVDKS